MRCKAHGKGEAILLIHGMPTNGRLWDGVVRDLSRHFRCFAIDLPGMGGTPFLPYSQSWFALVAEQIEQVRTRHHVQRWHVVGHDGGVRSPFNTLIFIPGVSLAWPCFPRPFFLI